METERWSVCAEESTELVRWGIHIRVFCNTAVLVMTECFIFSRWSEEWRRSVICVGEDVRRRIWECGRREMIQERVRRRGNILSQIIY